MSEFDVRALTLQLTPACPGRDGYTHMDRYRDFRAVFFGDATPEQKEKVLFQILSLSGLHLHFEGKDPYDTYRMLGRREVGLDLLNWLTHEPSQGHLSERTERE